MVHKFLDAMYNIVKQHTSFETENMKKLEERTLEFESAKQASRSHLQVRKTGTFLKDYSIFN